jgi:hypothetical protein
LRSDRDESKRRERQEKIAGLEAELQAAVIREAEEEEFKKHPEKRPVCALVALIFVFGWILICASSLADVRDIGCAVSF